MESKYIQKEKKIKKTPPKIYEEQTFSNIKFDLLKKKTKRAINIKRKSKRSKSKDSSKFLEINTTHKDFSNPIEIESSNSERETSLNTKKLIASNLIKTKNINKKENIDKKMEKIINLDEKEENNIIDNREEISKNMTKNLLKKNKTKVKIAVNSSEEKSLESKEKRNNNFKIKNSSKISINKEKDNRKKKERKVSHLEKGKLKNNIKPIKIDSSEEIISIDEEELKSSKIKNKFKNGKEDYSNNKKKAKSLIINEDETLNNGKRKRLIISKNDTIVTSKKKLSLSESENSSELNESSSEEEKDLNSGNLSNKSVINKEADYKEEIERKKFTKQKKMNISLEKEKYISYDSENTKNNKKKTKLFIGNIDHKTNINELSILFKQCGDIKKIKIFKNNKGKSKGCGFVEFKNPESAASAKKKINQKELRGRKLKIEFWKSKIDQKFEEFEKRMKTDKRELEEKLEADKRELKEKFKADKRELEKKLIETNKNVGILTEINIQSEKYINNYMNKTINNINMKLNCVINAFKVLYYRKIANFILDGLVNKYSKSLGVTKSKFFNQRSKFNLIIAIKDIKKINIYQINLIIDFLMHVKEKASSIIHINEKTFIQKKIFNMYIKNIRKKKYDSKNPEDEIIKIEEMVDTLFKKPEYIEEIINLNEDDDNIEQIESIIKNEKEKIIEENNNNDDNIDIKPSGSSTLNSEYDINKLKRILNGKENIKANLLALLETLHKKIILNEQKVKEDFIEFGIEEINSEYFYNSWIESFEKEKYKKSKNYTDFIKKDKILSLKNIGDNILKLLKGYKINVYVDDPGNFDKNLVNVIKSYNIQDGNIISVNY